MNTSAAHMVNAQYGGRFVGRVGALAVALGVGVVIAGLPAVAFADTTESSGSRGSAEQESGGSSASAAHASRAAAVPSRRGPVTVLPGGGSAADTRVEVPVLQTDSPADVTLSTRGHRGVAGGVAQPAAGVEAHSSGDGSGVGDRGGLGGKSRTATAPVFDAPTLAVHAPTLAVNAPALGGDVAAPVAGAGLVVSGPAGTVVGHRGSPRPDAAQPVLGGVAESIAFSPKASVPAAWFNPARALAPVMTAAPAAGGVVSGVNSTLLSWLAAGSSRGAPVAAPLAWAAAAFSRREWGARLATTQLAAATTNSAGPAGVAPSTVKPAVAVAAPTTPATVTDRDGCKKQTGSTSDPARTGFDPDIARLVNYPAGTTDAQLLAIELGDGTAANPGIPEAKNPQPLKYRVGVTFYGNQPLLNPGNSATTGTATSSNQTSAYMWLKKVKPSALRWLQDSAQDLLPVGTPGTEGSAWKSHISAGTNAAADPVRQLTALLRNNKTKLYSAFEGLNGWPGQDPSRNYPTGYNASTPTVPPTQYATYARQWRDLLTDTTTGLPSNQVAYGMLNEPDTWGALGSFPQDPTQHDYTPILQTRITGYQAVNSNNPFDPFWYGAPVYSPDIGGSRWTGGTSMYKSLWNSFDDKAPAGGYEFTNDGIGSTEGLWFRYRLQFDAPYPNPLNSDYYRKHTLNCDCNIGKSTDKTDSPNNWQTVAEYKDTSEWIKETAAQAAAWKAAGTPKQLTLDMHAYLNGTNPNNMLYLIERDLDIYEKAGFTGKFAIAETGNSPTNCSTCSPVIGTTEARWLRAVHYQLMRQFPDRYQGMIVHGNDVNATSFDAAKGAWWNPAYEGELSSYAAPNSTFTTKSSGRTVTLDPSAAVSNSDSPGEQYIWDFGDGTTITKNSKALQAYTFKTPGTYYVTLTVVNRVKDKSNPAVLHSRFKSATQLVTLK